MMDRRSLYDGLNQLEQEMNKNLEEERDIGNGK